MFKRRKEMQSLINASRKSLAEAESQITERNKLLGYQYETNQKLKTTINDIYNLATSNAYNNDKVILNKIKELVRPQNQY